MRKIILILLLVGLLAGCKSKEKKATDLIEKVQKSYNESELPWEKIESQVYKTNIAHNTPLNNQTCWDLALLCVEMEDFWNNNPQASALGEKLVNEPIYNLKNIISEFKQRKDNIGYEFYIKLKITFKDKSIASQDVRLVTDKNINNIILLEPLDDSLFERARFYISNLDSNNVEDYLLWK